MQKSASLGVLLDHAQDKVVLMSEDGTFEYANDAVERILGYAPADLVGENAFDYIHPDDVDDVRATFAEAIGSDEFVETTAAYRFQAADGSWTWLDSRMSNLTDEALDGYVVSSRDVSDRVAAEREHRETATRLEEIAASTGDVLWMFSGDWSEVLFLNPAYEDVYGRPVEEVRSDPGTFVEAVHPDDRPAVQEAMDCLASGNAVDMEYRVNPERDYGVWVWVQAEPIVEDGEVVRITGFTRDVTDRRRRERQLYVMDNLLRHNLRNDMTVILGNAALIEQEVPEAADRTAVIRRTGERLLESAEKEREVIDLLTSDGTAEVVDLAAVVDEAVAVVRGRFPDAVIEAPCKEGATVQALNELPAAVVELLENAVRHADSERPRVSLSVAVGDDRVVLSVADEAPAIPDIEARVLTGDYEMNDVYHSSGLGLWLVYWVVELSEGTIAVDAGDDGNAVHITVPRGDG